MIFYYILSDKLQSTTSIEEFISLLSTHQISIPSEKNIPNLSEIKKELSGYIGRVPLYDIKSNRIFLIHKSNVYSRIFRDDYRFVDQHFYDDLIKLKQPSEYDKQNIQILSYYDLNLLYKTYLKIFYESFVLDSYITDCKRPSFQPGLDHIKPYYKSTEIYYLAYDWNLTNNVTLQPNEIRKLCKEIRKYDIPANILLDHQMYIYDKKAIGLVKNYSLFGSYFINRYLRNYRCCMLEDPVIIDTESVPKIINPTLENQITLMINLIKSAPAFTNSQALDDGNLNRDNDLNYIPWNYTVYRFIDTDSYLSHLKEGDIYEDPSFLSTTRDPVYYQNNYSFGYILIKITLPGNKKGIGLCIESYSNFPEEQEIILPPTSRYKLIKVTEQAAGYHDVIELNKRVQKKYEFELLDNSYQNANKVNLKKSPNDIILKIINIDFKDLRTSDDIIYTSISERLNNFTKHYLNQNSQFSSTIGKTDYIFIIESYNSATVYKDFFYYKTENGLMCYSTNPVYGNINIMLELDVDIHVNYYFQFSVSDTSQQLDLSKSEWTDWLSLFAFAIGSKAVIIHSNYVLGTINPNDTIREKQNKSKYTYSDNIYQYLKYGKKLFDNVTGITPDFDYEQLNILSKTPISDIIKPIDKDELFQISINSNTTNVKDFYLYVIEKYPQFIKLIESKISVLYSNDVNPFYHISYTLDAWTYLYEKQLIHHLPSQKEFGMKKGSFKSLIGDSKIPQFKNRLRSYLLK